MSTTESLDEAHRDLQTARDCAEDPHRRVQYSRAAMDLAATVLFSHDVTPDQRRAAGECLAAATTLSGRSSPSSGGSPVQRSLHRHEPAAHGASGVRSGLR